MFILTQMNRHKQTFYTARLKLNSGFRTQLITDKRHTISSHLSRSTETLFSLHKYAHRYIYMCVCVVCVVCVCLCV